MDTDDDRAWLEELFRNSDFMGSNLGSNNGPRRSNIRLNPNAPEFIPRIGYSVDNGLRIRPAEDLFNQRMSHSRVSPQATAANLSLINAPANFLGNVQVDIAAAGDPGNRGNANDDLLETAQVDLAAADNPDGRGNPDRLLENAQDDLPAVGDPGARGNPDVVIPERIQINRDIGNDLRERQNEETRTRLQAIIEASENQAERARLAYMNLYGPGYNIPREYGRVNDRELRNDQRAFSGAPNDDQFQPRVMNENRPEFYRNRAGAMACDNRFYDRDNRFDYNGQEREYEGNNRVGPIRYRRGGQKQHQRDATYWRGRFFQLRNQSKKVKDFFFHDKF